MKTGSAFNNQGASGLLLVAAIGILVAGGTFLATFITTQKAKTPDPRVNLRIPVPSIPPRKPLESLPSIVQPTPELTVETLTAATEPGSLPNESSPSATEEVLTPEL